MTSSGRGCVLRALIGRVLLLLLIMMLVLQKKINEIGGEKTVRDADKPVPNTMTDCCTFLCVCRRDDGGALSEPLVLEALNII